MFWRQTSTKIINDVVQTGLGPGGALIVTTTNVLSAVVCKVGVSTAVT